MAYDSDLAERIRQLLPMDPAIQERKMFGGLCVLLNGNMACGVVKNDLMVRVGPERYQEALQQPGAREMDFTGKPLKGMVYVSPDVLGCDEALDAWLQQGLDFAQSLPAK